MVIANHALHQPRPRRVVHPLINESRRHCRGGVRTTMPRTFEQLFEHGTRAHPRARLSTRCRGGPSRRQAYDVRHELDGDRFPSRQNAAIQQLNSRWCDRSAELQPGSHRCEGFDPQRRTVGRSNGGGEHPQCDQRGKALISPDRWAIRVFGHPMGRIASTIQRHDRRRCDRNKGRRWRGGGGSGGKLIQRRDHRRRPCRFPCHFSWERLGSKRGRALRFLKMTKRTIPRRLFRRIKRLHSWWRRWGERRRMDLHIQQK